MALSFAALGRVLQHVGRLLLLRADLAAEELALARRQWLGWIAGALAAAALLMAAVLAAGAWLTLLLWDRYGAATPGALALLLAAVGVLLIRGVLRAAHAAPTALAQTRTALREDYDALIAAAAPADKTGQPEA